MKVFIRSSACISAQNTFNTGGFLTDAVEHQGNRLRAIEPDYKEYIDPKLTRRMGHVIKMGVAAAKRCLMDAGVQMPGAIITGSAYGCVEDTVTFLTRIIEEQEELLPATAFIQSTHNTVAAQIALLLQCHNYNQTFVHKGISFESALFDAMMLLNEHEADNILVGGVDEMVDTNFKVLTRLGLFKRKETRNLDLYSARQKGTIGGEGAAFFLLSGEASGSDMAVLKAIKILYEPKDITESIIDFLAANSLTINDVDLTITGRNGDARNDKIYGHLNNSLFRENAVANYKHLSGDYPVSTSFALWLAANIIKSQAIPPVIMEQGKVNSPKNVLIYNHYQQNYHSLMLVSAV